MPSGSNIRTIRFVLLAFFTFAVIYKIRTSYYITDISSPGKGGVGSTPLDNLNGASKGHAADTAAPEKDAESQSVTDTLIHGRANATFITLARNTDLWDMAESIRHVEDRFNRKYHYDWVFLNDQPFDDAFKKLTSNLVSGKAKYGVIPKEHWSFPEWIDQEKAKDVREEMKRKKIIYGDSISYRHMCRFESGFFYRHELLDDYEMYWRVEPSIKLFCDIDFDPFVYMKKNNKKYGFVLSLYEYIETIPTLWKTVKDFMKEHPEHVAEGNAMKFLSDDGGNTYNKCHFWSNFEIGSLDFLRSKAYMDYFSYLDRSGGFFYERWGDAPVHSIAAALFLKKEQLHFFNEIGYYHIPFTHCPTSESDRLKFKCTCKDKDNFDWKGYSCTSRYFDMMQMQKPEGWEKQQ